MKKIIMLVEGMSEAELCAVMTSPKIQNLLAVFTYQMGVNHFYFGAGKSAPLSEVQPHFDKFAASLN